MSVGVAGPGPVHPALRRRPSELPIFEKLYLGGEYSIRGFDIRSIGPRDLDHQLVLGGNKSLLFNAEYIIQIAGPVRLVMFYDAGQVRNYGDSRSAGRKTILRSCRPPAPLLIDPLRSPAWSIRSAPGPTVSEIGSQARLQDLDRRRDPLLHAGAERAVPADLRLEPVARRGATPTTSQPAKEFTFRFAVGSTF